MLMLLSEPTLLLILGIISNLSTIILLEQLEQDFPYWKHLHGFWCTLPNFNPYIALSEPGQDLAAEMLVLVQGHRDSSGDGGLDDKDIQDSPLLSTGLDDQMVGSPKLGDDILEIKKQRINLEANKKQLQAEECWIIAQHQWECEKEAHNIQMLHLHLQYQEAGGSGVGQFRTAQFGDNGAFGGAGLGLQTDFGLPSLPPFNG
ncbi:hypothetical protein L208DRAFT_1381681 [Tricholoma matsutake]|nr:hypothetical protein L208DRAFT_1381681 [Tricholoma matsutake 945]